MVGKKSKARTKKKGSNLLKRRLLATVLLIFFAGFATLSAVTWTRPVKADDDLDPYFTLSTGPPKVRILTPINNSVDNDEDVTISGETIPNSTVAIEVDDASVGTATSNDKGAWSKSVSNLEAGNHEVSASVSVGGPLAVVTSSIVPGYSVVNLQNDSLAASSITGLGFLYNGLLRDSGANPGAYAAVNPNNSDYVYLVRDRNVLVLDAGNFTPLKTISTSSQFLAGNEGEETDTGDQYKQIIQSPDGTRLYLLYNNGSVSTRGKIVTIDTTTNQLMSNKTFDLAGDSSVATNMAISNDGEKIYAVAPGSNQLSVVNTGSGASDVIELSSQARAMTASADGNTMYVAREVDSMDSVYYVASISVSSDEVNEQAVNLGTNLRGDMLYAASGGEKLYVASDSSTDLRVVDIESGTLSATIELPDLAKSSPNSIVENQDGTRIYFPLRSDDIAIVGEQDNAYISRISPPVGDYSEIGGVMYHNNKIYATYIRQPSIADITDPTNLFSSLGVANSNITSDTAATALSINGVASNAISEPVSISTKTFTTTTKFSTGVPIAITSPADNETLETAEPTIRGTGPRGVKIQVSVNAGKPVNVTVGSDGKWQTKVKLAKNKNSEITAVYQNKRAQLIIPSIFMFGNNISRSQLSVIDGGSDLETQSIALPNIGLSNIKLSTSAAINPNGQRIYLVNDDLSFVPTYLTSILSNPEVPPDAQQILNDLADYQIGSIDVFSTQSREKTETINLPVGQVPLGISVSPDGKKAMITTANLGRIAEMVSGNIGDDQTQILSPLEIHGVDLVEEELSGDPYRFTIDVTGFGAQELNQDAMNAYLSVASLAFFVSKSGTYNADGSKFYTSALSPGKYKVLDTATGEVATVSLPEQYENAILMSTQINAKTNTLYATYAGINLPTEENPVPSFVPGLILMDAKTGQYEGGSVLPELPIFSFAVSSSGTKVYLETVNVIEFIEALGSSVSNPGGVLVNTVPRFDLSVYDLNTGTYTSHKITDTEIPINLALSPDGGKVYIPTFAQNVVHVFDTKTNTMNSGNAPILLSGVSIMFGTSDYIGENILGTYNDSRSYFVPADPPPPPQCVTNCDPVVINNNTGSTTYRYLPASTQAAIKPTALALPNQTATNVQQTIAETVKKSNEQKIVQNIKSWLIYVFYGLLMATLLATGVVIWRTDLLIGETNEEGLF